MKRSILLAGVAAIGLAAGVSISNAQQSTAEEPTHKTEGVGGPKAAPPTEKGQRKAGAAEEKATGNRAAGAMKDEKTTGAAMNDEKKNVKPNAEGGKAESNSSAVNQNQKGETVEKRAAAEHSGAAMHITSEARTRLQSEVTHVNIREASNINVQVSIGATAPRTIVEYWQPVPANIVEIVPEWRSFYIVRVHQELLIIDPNTFEIVYVLNV